MQLDLHSKTTMQIHSKITYLSLAYNAKHNYNLPRSMWVSLFLHTPTTCKTQSELFFSELCFSFCLPLLLAVRAGGMPANTENVVASDGVPSSSKVRALPSLIGSTACLGFCRGWQRWSENSALARHCADQGAAILRAKPADSGYRIQCAFTGSETRVFTSTRPGVSPFDAFIMTCIRNLDADTVVMIS